MRSDKEVAKEALLRAETIKKKKADKKRLTHSLYYAAACIAIIIGLAYGMPAAGGGMSSPNGLYGAVLFAGSSAGGYILIGVIGFVLGAVVVLLYKRNMKA